jgi:hypothetical protein
MIPANRPLSLPAQQMMKRLAEDINRLANV